MGNKIKGCYIYWIGQKVRLGFSISSYRKTQMNFLANPTHIHIDMCVCTQAFIYLYIIIFISLTFTLNGNKWLARWLSTSTYCTYQSCAFICNPPCGGRCQALTLVITFVSFSYPTALSVLSWFRLLGGRVTGASPATSTMFGTRPSHSSISAEWENKYCARCVHNGVSAPEGSGVS